MEQVLQAHEPQVVARRRTHPTMSAVVLAVGAITGGALLWEARTLGFHYLGLPVAVAACLAVWAVLELAWGLVLTLRGVEPGHGAALPGRRRLFAWFVLVVVLVGLKAPVHANLAMSRAALTEQVRAVQAGQPLDESRRIGGFDVVRATTTEPGCVGAACEVVLLLGGGQSALVWSATGDPRYLLADSNGRLFGPWYWSIDE